MTLDADALRHLGQEFVPDGFCLLAGAGVSAAAPACAPLFRPLRDGLLERLCESLDGELDERLLAQGRALFSHDTQIRRGVEPVPEVLFEALHGTLGEPLFDALRILLRLDGPNSNHLCAAHLAPHHLRLLITTNFDDGFEQAFASIGRQHEVCADGPTISRSASALDTHLGQRQQVPIWKVHGTLAQGAEETIRVTLSQVARESLDPRKFEPIVKATARLPMLVVGYSGYDTDVSRTLIQAGETGRRLYWLSYREPGPDDPCRRILRAWKDRGQLLIGDLNNLLTWLSAEISDVTPAKSTATCDEPLAKRLNTLAHWMTSLRADDRLMALAALCWNLASFDTALAILGLLEERAVAARDSQRLLTCLVMTTNVLRSSDRGAELGPALKRLKTMREKLGPFGDPALAGLDAMLLHEMGGYFRSIGEREAAETAFRKALAAAHATENPKTIAFVAQSLGAFLSHAGTLREARHLFEVAHSAAVASGDRSAQIKAAHELGIVAFESGDPGKAASLFTESVDAAREIGAADLECASLFELGIVALRARLDYDDAQGRFAEVERLGRLLGLKKMELSALLYLGDVEQERGHHERSIERFTECAGRAHDLGDGAIEATALCRRARGYAMRRDVAHARADLQQARTLSQRWHLALLSEIDALSEWLRDQ